MRASRADGSLIKRARCRSPYGKAASTATPRRATPRLATPLRATSLHDDTAEPMKLIGRRPGPAAMDPHAEIIFIPVVYIYSETIIGVYANYCGRGGLLAARAGRVRHDSVVSGPG